MGQGGTRGGCGEDGDFCVFSVFGRGKEGREGFFVFRFFFGGRPCGWAGFCVGVCEQGGCPPLVWVLVGGDGVRQRCLVWLVCCVYDRDACVGCGGRRGQDVGGAWNVRKPRRWRREEKGPVVCVPAP